MRTLDLSVGGNLKDGGHMRDGRIDCSATLGRLSAAGPQTSPRSHAGRHPVYPNLPPLRMGGHTGGERSAGRLGSWSTALQPQDLDPPPLHFTVSR